MAANFPGPWQVIYHYTYDNLDHILSVNCDLDVVGDVGDPFTEFDVKLRSGGTQALETAVDDFIDLLRPWWYTDVTISHCELWKYTALSFDKTWYSALTLGLAGTATDPTNPASEIIWTMRTQEGGILKITQEETKSTSYSKVAWGSLGAGTPGDLLGDYLEAPTNWILARDTSYPIARLSLLPGQNERIFKQRYR